MSRERPGFTIDRILVALDGSSHSLAALEAALDLADRFGAEVTGIFVEDENLLRLAGLPFVSEIGGFTAARRAIDGPEMERQVRAQSRRVRQVFARTTRRAQVTCSFRIARGAVLQEVLAAASEADMIVLGRRGSSLRQRGRLGSTVLGILPEPLGLALILKEGTGLGDPVAVVYDGSRGEDRALSVAASLRRQPQEDRSLLALLVAVEPSAAQKLREQVAARVSDPDAAVHYFLLTSTNVQRWAELLQQESCGGLVLPARSGTLGRNRIAQLLEILDVPVLLVS